MMSRKKAMLILAAAVIGFASSRFVVGWYTTIPWILATLSVGYLAANRQAAIINGALFGYVIFVVYMPTVYRGASDAKSILRFMGFVLAFSIIGAMAGIVGGFLGNLIRGKVS